jgi:hypothetical protein
MADGKVILNGQLVWHDGTNWMGAPLNADGTVDVDGTSEIECGNCDPEFLVAVCKAFEGHEHLWIIEAHLSGHGPDDEEAMAEHDARHYQD